MRKPAATEAGESERGGEEEWRCSMCQRIKRKWTACQFSLCIMSRAVVFVVSVWHVFP